MNIGSSIDEKKGNLKFLRWIDLSNELSKIKLVNKYVIIRGLRDWKILAGKNYKISMYWVISKSV